MQELENIKSVIIIRSGALGDTVYSSVVLDALVQQYGEGLKIDWIGAPSIQSLFKYDKRVEQTFIIKHRKFPIWLSKEKRKIISFSKSHPYDLLINLESDGPTFNPLAVAIHARHKIGYPFSKPVHKENDRHMVEHIRAHFSAIIDEGIINNTYPKLFGKEFDNLKEKYSLPEQYIIINPSNSHTNRNKINYRAWPAEKWKELIHRLGQQENLILIGNKGEEKYFDLLKPYPKKVIDLSGKTDLTELISIMSQAKALITTDTGPAHVASATGTPVYCLIGPTDPALTGPYKTPYNEIHIISKNLECSPCYFLPHIKTCRDNICMKEITVDDVLNSLEESE